MTATDAQQAEPVIDEQLQLEWDATSVGGAECEDELTEQVYRYARLRTAKLAEIDRIRAQTERMFTRLNNDIAALDWKYQNLAEKWTRERLRGRRKSVDTPFARLGFTSRAARLAVIDPEAFKAYVMAHGLPTDLIRIKEEANVAELSKWFKENGFVPDGTTLIEGGETFNIKAQKEKDDDGTE